MGPGRGSAAGSLVSYAMEITDIDPLQYGLLFERFLNPERISMPDIDIDFCTNRRGEVIQYVTEKYGREQVAQIITFSTLGARAAIKDVGRVLDMPFADVDRLTKLVPNAAQHHAEGGHRPGARLQRSWRKKDPRVDEVLEVALRLEGLARNCSVHAAGVVISPQPLQRPGPALQDQQRRNCHAVRHGRPGETAAAQDGFPGPDHAHPHPGRAAPDREAPRRRPSCRKICRSTTQATYEDLLQGLHQRRLPVRIAAACATFCAATSPAASRISRALNALYRPGPIQGGMIDDFIERKHGRKAVVYDLPELKELLEETYGVIVYQEQVMQISNRLAGYSLGDADLLRRAMGKKKLEEMAKQRERFIKGALERGFPQKKVEKIFDLMEQFAGYGFNKSHSAAYAYLAFVTAYLKAHYPVEFMAALLTSETGNTAKVVKYINECREMGITVLPPDVNHSDWSFTPDGDAIRFGLGAVKNLGPIRRGSHRQGARGSGPLHVAATSSARRWISARQPPHDRKPDQGRRHGFAGGHARQKLAAVEGAMEAGQRAQRDRESGQVRPVRRSARCRRSALPTPLPNVPDWTAKEKLAGEKEMLGFYVTGHPLDRYMDKVRELATHDSSQPGRPRQEHRSRALRRAHRHHAQAQSRRQAVGAMQLEDRTGSVEAMVFATNYERLASQVVEDKAVLVRGLVLPEENAPPKISVQDIVPLDNARVDLPGVISIRVWLGRNGGVDRAAALEELFKRKPGPTSVRLRLEAPRDFSVLLDVPAKVRPDREFKAAVEQICGPVLRGKSRGLRPSNCGRGKDHRAGQPISGGGIYGVVGAGVDGRAGQSRRCPSPPGQEP